MKLIFTLLSLLLTLNAYATSPWQKYVGCYKAVTFDGKPAGEEIDTKIDGYWASRLNNIRDPNSNEIIPGIDVFLPLWDNTFHVFYYVNVPVMSDRGRFWSDANGDHYEFDGPVSARKEGELIKTHFFARVDIGSNQDGSLTVTMEKKLDNCASIYSSEKKSAVLMPTRCCDPSIELCHGY
jgi:hypothetical protein